MKSQKSAEAAELFRKDWIEKEGRGRLLPEISNGVEYNNWKERDRKYIFPIFACLSLFSILYLGVFQANPPISEGILKSKLLELASWESIVCDRESVFTNIKCTATGKSIRKDLNNLLEGIGISAEKWTRDSIKLENGKRYAVLSSRDNRLEYRLTIGENYYALQIRE